MAGRKVFTSGEILTAADVNSYLMNQVVAVFADSTARSSAIPTPSEGMVTFREDQDVVEVYDGSAFKTVGGLVAVESVLKTDTFSASVGEGGNVAVTDLSITHEVSDPANRLIISAFFGAAQNSSAQADTGIAVHDGTGLLAIGDASASRSLFTAGKGGGVAQNRTTSYPHITIVHTPGAGSKTYTVRAINARSGTNTVFINRSLEDNAGAVGVRAASGMTIQEVAV